MLRMLVTECARDFLLNVTFVPDVFNETLTPYGVDSLGLPCCWERPSRCPAMRSVVDNCA